MKLQLVRALLWLVHLLPFCLMRAIALPMGWLFYLALGRRRKIGLTNLQLCFPDWSAAKRQQTLRQHFVQMCSVILAYSILLWGSPSRIRNLVRVEGFEHFEAVADRPIIILAPHFIGLDFGASVFRLERSGASMYSQQRGVFHDISLQIRSRFNQPTLIKRTEGIRPVVRALKQKLPFYYLPDQDLGAKESIFAPFFGIQTATVPALAKLAAVSGAAVIPVITTLQGNGFVSRYYPAWDHYPSNDTLQDTSRMNAFIEQIAREYPSQYYWLHRRFKTRPEGEDSVY